MNIPSIRVGQGFDIHPFIEDEERPLVLGGVAFVDKRALRGHSDSDVIAHAATDAILGAAGLGDIGALYPDTDARWAGVDSLDLLADAASRVRDAGWQIGNVDISVVTDTPKIAPVREIMQERLGGAVGAPVTVKGKRPEGVGSLGRGDAVAAWAVAIVIGTPQDETPGGEQP